MPKPSERRVTTPLLRDPISVSKPATKPQPTTTTTTTTKASPHSDEVRWFVVGHEAAHAVVALMLHREVMKASALPDESSDGRVQYSTTADARSVNACIGLAGQVWDEIVGQRRSPEKYATDNKQVVEDIGNDAEKLEAIKAKTRELLIEAFPAVIEVSR
jgi:hypothetical protein